MGFTYANIIIQNANDLALCESHVIGEEEVRQIEINALVDTGSTQICINEVLQKVLGLKTIGKRTSQLADGRRVNLPIVGPIKILHDDRYSLTSALVLPGDSEPLLGAIPLEEMDYYVHPAGNKLVAAHPDGWVMTVKVLGKK